MSSPTGVVDLSLPDYATLVARAGVHPDAEAARVAGASPAAVSGASAAFGRAGGEFDTAFGRSLGAASTLGTAFVNDGAAVYDRGTHLGNLPAGFGDAGSRLAGASSRLTAVADDLTATMRATSSAVSGLHAELAGMRSQWAARVAAVGTGPGGLIPEAAIPALLAERDRVATAMTGRVGEVGRAVTDRIRGYEVVVHDALRLLADQGFVPVADLDRPAPAAPRLEGGVDPTGFGTPLMAGYAADPVNTGLGNFVEVETDLSFPGLLAGLTVARTYNSCSDGSCSDGGGPFGARWSCWATTRLTVGTWTAAFDGPDGQRVEVPRTGPAEFGRVAGLDARVEPLPDPGGAALAWFDGRRWEFDASGRIARTWAGPGTAVAFVHADGRLVEMIHERGRRVRFEWADGRIVAAEADGLRVDYGYADGRLAVVDGPQGGRRYDHDDAGRVASVTDADGVVELVNTYDPAGRVLTQRSPFGRTVTFTYAADGSTVVADDAAGPRNVYRHDHAGRLVAVTDGHGNTQHRRFDRWGNPVEIVERGGAVTRQEFDARSRLVRRTLPAGAVETFTWDADDRLVEVGVMGPDLPAAVTRLRYDGRERTPSEIVDPEGGVTRFAVAGGLVTAVTDADGVTVRYRHDAGGHVVEAVDARGGVTRIERNSAGRPTAVTTPAGRRTELVWDAAGRVAQRRDPAGGVWRHEYTPAGRLRALVDPAGARREIRYGGHGEAAELVDPLGGVTSRCFDELGNLVAVASAAGEKSTYGYDALCRLAAWSDAAGGTWVVEHDADGNPTATIDPTGVREDRTHDAAGRLLRVDDGLVVTGYRYDPLGRPVAQVRPDGTTREVGHDRCGRPVALTGPDGAVTRLSYTPAGRLAQVVHPTGRTERREYDEAGRLAVVVDGTGQAWRYRHDADGLLVERISPAGVTESLTRDAAGRVVRHVVPGRGRTAWTYDPAGRVVETTDRHGRRQFAHDAAGRVTAVTDALGHTTRHTYDPDGHLLAVTDPLGQVTRHAWDGGRVTAVTDPLGRVTRYRYDPAGRLRERHDPDGAHRTIDHDRSGRPCGLTATRGPDRVTITVERDVLARPVRIAEAGADPIELGWDRAGRLARRRRADRVVGWSYDADGLPTAVHNPDGTATTYRRDGAGRVTAVEHPLVGRVELRRDPDGRPVGVHDSRVEVRLGHTDGWLTSYDVTTGRGRCGTRLTRDDDGRVVAADVDGRPARYGYDAAGQLCRATDATGEYRFDHDAAGRLVVETRSGEGERRYGHDAAGQLATISSPDGEHRFAHDECGRRVAEDAPGRTRRYRWDPLGRLTAVTTVTGTGQTTALHVDALGELVGVGDVPVDHDSADPFGPLLALGDTVLIGHGHPWAQAGARGAAPLVPDWQHTPAAPPGDPWGATEAAGGPAIGYRGELTVDGLVWLRNRAYDPATRAFLSPDPLPPVPGTAYAANSYHYAGNDPINAVDPLGLRPLTDADLAAFRYAGVDVLAQPGAVPPGGDPYRGVSSVNGLLTAGDVAGGFYGSKLEVDAHYMRLTGQYQQAHARENLTRVRQGPVVNPTQFYDDLDHYTAVGRNGDDLVAQAARLDRASKFTPPKIGGGLALAGIGYDIATGKDPVQAVAAGGGGFLASVAAGAAIGTFIPIPGVGTAVGAVVGAGVGIFTSGAIDSLFENGFDLGAAGSRGLEAVTDTGEAIAGGIGKAAGAIGGLFD